MTLELREQLDAATIAEARARLEQSPLDLETNLVLVSLLLGSQQNDEALARSQRLIEAFPHSQKAWLLAGTAQAHVARWDIALHLYNRALAIAPDMPGARWNRFWANQALGNYREAWEDQEHGRRNGMRKNRLMDREWRGEDVSGKIVFVWSEQGLGDCIQYARYLSRLKELGCRVVLETYAPLKRLLEPLADGVVVLPDDFSVPFGQWDYHVPLLTLPLRLGEVTGDWSIPAGKILDIPLVPEEGRVGFCWAGRPEHPNNANRSLTVDEAKMMEGAVHVGYGQRAPFELEDGTGGDFLATAYDLARCRELVTIDSAVAHLAGAMGVPVKMMTPLNGEPRWRQDGPQPWYESLSLYRPQGGFAGVLREIRETL